MEIGHDLFALLAAFLGALLVRAIFASPVGRPESSEPDADLTIRPSRKRWLRLTLIALVGLVVVFSVFTIGFVSDAAFWAGATFSLTCGLMGLVTLGAIFGRGRSREAWLGATLFGAGYLLLVFARPPYPALPTLWRPSGHHVVSLYRLRTLSLSTTPDSPVPGRYPQLDFRSAPRPPRLPMRAPWRRSSSRSRCPFPTRHRWTIW